MKINVTQKNTLNLRDENFLINKTRAKIVTRAANLSISFKNVFRISIKLSHHYTTIKTKSLRQ